MQPYSLHCQEQSFADRCKSTGGDYDGRVSTERPVFHPDFGAFLVGLREAKGWSQSGAAQLAERRKVPITYQELRGVESGATKDVEPETLLALAKLYDVPFGLIAALYFREKFGAIIDADLIRHTGEPSSGLSSGGSRHGATATRVLELERQVNMLTTKLGQVEDVASQLLGIAAISDEDRSVVPARTSSGRSHRKTHR